MKWKNEGHELDSLFEIIENSKGLWIWGTANIGSRMHKMYGNDFSILGVVDSAPDKQGIIWNEYEIIPPQKLEVKPGEIVIVATSAFPQIKRVLDSRGLKMNKDYFDYFVFCQIVELYMHNKLFFRRIDISLTEKCTLRCEKCNMFMPYFKTPCDMEIQEAKKNIDVFFEAVDFVESLNLLGGEPLLYAGLANLVDYINAKFRNKCEHVKIFTNGTLRFSQDLLKACNRCHVEVQISDYTNNVNYKNRLDEVIAQLNENGIDYYILQSDTWGDFGFPENPNRIKDECVEAYFDNCKAPFRGIYDEKIYYCHLETSAIRAGLYKDNDNDYYRLTDSTDKMRLLEFDFGYNRDGGISFCKVCRGCAPQNSLLVEAAKQVDKCIVRQTR